MYVYIPREWSDHRGQKKGLDPRSIQPIVNAIRALGFELAPMKEESGCSWPLSHLLHTPGELYLELPRYTSCISWASWLGGKGSNGIVWMFPLQNAGATHMTELRGGAFKRSPGMRALQLMRWSLLALSSSVGRAALTRPNTRAFSLHFWAHKIWKQKNKKQILLFWFIQSQLLY